MKFGAFTCDRCGLCCRLIGGIPQLVAFDRGDGVCCHLTEDNLCDIYDSRPEICSVESMYVHFADHMSKEEYLDLMTRACQLIKERFAILCEGQTALHSCKSIIKGTKMKQDKNGRRQVLKTTDAANAGKQTEEGKGYATIGEISQGILGFVPAIARHMHLSGGRVGGGKESLE